jgi:hypothetical protein
LIHVYVGGSPAYETGLPPDVEHPQALETEGATIKMIVLFCLCDYVKPGVTLSALSGAWLLPVYTFGILVLGTVIVVAIALHNSESGHRADILRAIGDLFRGWFWRGRPPGGKA